MNRIALAALAGASMLLAGTAFAQPAQNLANVVIKPTDLGKRTWMLEGQGGNMVVAAGDDGVILVDGELLPLHDKIKAAIKAVSDQPVKYLIDTHYHGDHTGGNQGFWIEGTTVVAQANTAKYLAEGSTNPLTGSKTAPVVKGAQPNQTYGEALTLKVKGRTAQLTHMHAAHTGGDTAVFFPDANVLVTGDIVTIGGRFPGIDLGAGGAIKGMIDAVDAYLKRSNAGTKIVPGHGPLMNRAQLVEYRAMLAASRDAVAKLIKDGKTAEEAVAAKPLAEIQAKIGASDMVSANFVRQIYKSLKT